MIDGRNMEFEKKKVEWLEFDLLEPYPHVVHGVFLRHGGASKGPFASLNLSSDVGDHPDSVKVNREAVRKATDFAKIIYAQQTHGTNVHRVNAKNFEKSVAADALFTTEKNLGLAVTHADCQAAIFYDPVHEAIAIAHCGWRGTSQNIYSRVVAAMHQEIGTQAHNLLVCISPSLGPDHAEYKNYKHEIPQDFWNLQTKPNHFDFWAISRKQLNACGIPDKNIEVSGLCTVCNANDYFSYRLEKKTGRNVTVAGLKE
jgi:YfiH family protein